MSSVGAHWQRSAEFARRFDRAMPLVGAEIGVFQAEGAVRLLADFPRLALTAVDQWQPTARYLGTGDPTAPLVGDRCYLGAIHALLAYRDRATVLRAASLSVAAVMPGQAFDFVFIDAEHTRAAVLEDCRAWWPKVKSGGWLCGHDYGCGPKHPHVAGVTTAVNEFAAEVGGAVETIGAAGDHTWWIRKQ